MKIKIVTILCEGPHDAAFLRKILRANGFNSYDGKKIKEYPTPMNDFVKRNLEKSNIEDLNIQEAKKHSYLIMFCKKKIPIYFHIFWEELLK